MTKYYARETSSTGHAAYVVVASTLAALDKGAAGRAIKRAENAPATYDPIRVEGAAMGTVEASLIASGVRAVDSANAKFGAAIDRFERRDAVSMSGSVRALASRILANRTTKASIRGKEWADSLLANMYDK